MHIKQIQLKNIRTFENTSMDFSKGIHLITGSNASGKTNLLESILYLATTKSIQHRNDKNIISQEALNNSVLPIAKISAVIESDQHNHDIDMMFSKPIKESIANDNQGSGRLTKNFRLNGVTKKASDVIGTLRAVYASPNDMEIILGSPSERRKYLDILISQFDKDYLKNLQRYNRIIKQRNSLLKQIKNIKKRHGELDYWDDQISATAIEIINKRKAIINQLSTLAKSHYEILDKNNDKLAINYYPSLPKNNNSLPTDDIDQKTFLKLLQEVRNKDLQQSNTTIGPHRDDILIFLNELPSNAFSSRGQQKLITICMRLAEAQISHQITNEQPVLLLDDILSEFDQEHRNYIVENTEYVEQVFLTTPDLANVPKAMINKAVQLQIHAGEIKKL
jgi:DNA replication and repair protein RecF